MRNRGRGLLERGGLIKFSALQMGGLLELLGWTLTHNFVACLASAKRKVVERGEAKKKQNERRQIL